MKTRFHRAQLMMREQLDQAIIEAGNTAFEFAGARCDRIVSTVLKRLDQLNGHLRQSMQIDEDSILH